MAADDLKDRVSRALAEAIGPALAADGLDLEVLDVVEGVVRVRPCGSCGCCPSSVMAIILGIEEELRRRVPEVDYLELAP